MAKMADESSEEYLKRMKEKGSTCTLAPCAAIRESARARFVWRSPEMY